MYAPDDVWTLLLVYLDVLDVLALSTTSRRMYHICTDFRYWRMQFLHAFPAFTTILDPISTILPIWRTELFLPYAHCRLSIQRTHQWVQFQQSNWSDTLSTYKGTNRLAAMFDAHTKYQMRYLVERMWEPVAMSSKPRKAALLKEHESIAPNLVVENTAHNAHVAFGVQKDTKSVDRIVVVNTDVDKQMWCNPQGRYMRPSIVVDVPKDIVQRMQSVTEQYDLRLPTAIHTDSEQVLGYFYKAATGAELAFPGMALMSVVLYSYKQEKVATTLWNKVKGTRQNKTRKATLTTVCHWEPAMILAEVQTMFTPSGKGVILFGITKKNHGTDMDDSATCGFAYKLLMDDGYFRLVDTFHFVDDTNITCISTNRANPTVYVTAHDHLPRINVWTHDAKRIGTLKAEFPDDFVPAVSGLNIVPMFPKAKHPVTQDLVNVVAIFNHNAVKVWALSTYTTIDSLDPVWTYSFYDAYPTAFAVYSGLLILAKPKGWIQIHDFTGASDGPVDMPVGSFSGWDIEVCGDYLVVGETKQMIGLAFH
jgi:hypothetical protein